MALTNKNLSHNIIVKGRFLVISGNGQQNHLATTLQRQVAKVLLLRMRGHGEQRLKNTILEVCAI